MESIGRWRGLSVWIVGTLAAGLLCSLLAARWQAQTNAQQAQAALQNTAARMTESFARRMQIYEYGLRGARGAVLTAGPERLDRSVFRQYAESRDLASEFPGAAGFGFIRRVPRAAEAAFVRQAQTQGLPEFAVRELSPHEGDRYLITHLEPEEPNAAALGLDIASEALRLQAAQTAMRTGAATATGPITLVQGLGRPERGLLILLPVYRTGTTPTDPAARERQLWGWVYTPLSLDTMLAGIGARAEGVSMTASDAGNGASPATAAAPAAAGRNTLVRDETLRIFGRHWQLRYTAGPAFTDALHQLRPQTVFLTGALASVLLASLVGLYRAVRDKSRQADVQRARLASVVDSSADAVIGQDTDGRVVFWNGAAERLFGFRAEEAVGQPVDALIFLPEHRGEDAELLARVLGGNGPQTYDTVRWNRAGAPIDVSISAGPIRGTDGRIIGVAKVLHDIRGRIAAQKQLRAFNQRLEEQVRERTEALARAHHDLKTLIDALPTMIGYWDRDLRNRVANKAYAELFGQTVERLPGIHMAELLSPEGFEAMRPLVEAALQGQPQSFERAIPMPAGAPPLQVLAHYLPDRADGQVRGCYVIMHDISELVRGRQALAEEREYLNQVIDGTMAGTWAWNVATGECRFNTRWAQMLGYRLEELQPLDITAWQRLMHPQDLAVAQAALARHLAAPDEVYVVETRLRHKDGRWVWVLSRGRMTAPSQPGGDTWMYGTHLDITTAKLDQLQLEHTRVLLQSVLQSATELSIIATDTEGTVTLFNTGAERMLGYRAEDMVGRSTPAPLHVAEEMQARGAELTQIHGQPIEGFRVFVHEPEIRGAETREWTYVRRDGSTLPVSLTATTIRANDGRLVGYLGVAQDISERRRTELALRQATQVAEAASQAKGRFLANMSHEIRTPLNAVIGISELLIDSALNPDQLQLMRKLQLAGRSLLGVVNDVLDLSRIESGQLRLERVAFSPHVMSAEVADLFEAQANAKGLAMHLRGLEGLPERVVGDLQRLRQMLINLMTNALKFTATGAITLQVASLETPEQPGLARIRWTVRDTGCGIAPQVLGQLFQPFVQADVSTTRRFGGSGLGLAIVHELARLMGGQVGVESTLGEGSSFWIELPLQIGEEADGDATALEAVVVDDQEPDRARIAAMCRAFGWQVVELDTGEALLAHMQARRDREQPPPDVLLVDWQLPQLDGLQSLERLASRLERLPAALVVSAHEQAQIEATTRHAPVDRVLIKPVDASELFNAVNQAVVAHSGRMDHVLNATQLAGTRTRWLAGLHLLLVDDSEINREIGRRLLEREGARVSTADDGAEALERLRAEPAAFDLVLMDVQMPRMDGREATRRARDELGLVELPILAVTAGALEEERRLALQAGMNGFLVKPLNAEALIRAVRKEVERVRARPLLVASRGQGGSAPPDWPAIDGIDAATASARCDGDAALFLSLLDRMLAEHRPEDAPQEPALRAARMHKLRGGAGMLGARALHQLAGEAEAAIHANAPAPAVAALLQAVAAELARLEAAARPLLRAQQTRAAASVPATPLDPQELGAFAQLLRQQDFAALAWFDARVDQLRATLDEAACAALQQAMHGMDFDAALGLLQRHAVLR